MARNKRVKYGDLKAGVTVYKVYAFPNRANGSAWVETYHVLGRPAASLTGKEKKNHFVPYTEFVFIGSKRMEHKFSVSDTNVIPGYYNWHRLFHTKAAAERYAHRMRTGCLTAHERKHGCGAGRHVPNKPWNVTAYKKRAVFITQDV